MKRINVAVDNKTADRFFIIRVYLEGVNSDTLIEKMINEYWSEHYADNDGSKAKKSKENQ